jgi:hypothetical protein
MEKMPNMLKAVVDEVLKACKTLSRKSDIQAIREALLKTSLTT